MSFFMWTTENYEALSRQSAERIMEALWLKPNMLLCAAGGSTPLRAYQLLAARRDVERQKFDRLRLVKLDEWGGLELNDRGSCETQMRSYLIDPLGIEATRYIGFDSNPVDPEGETARVRNRLAA